MGCAQTKEKSDLNENAVEGLKTKVRLLQGEINELMCIREGENQVYERELMVFAFKQGEWRRERKRLKGEVKKMKKVLEEKEEKLRYLESNVRMQVDHDQYDIPENGQWDYFGTRSSIMQQVKDEKLRRDETVEKWKQLYFAIKVELDDLIERTHQEERTCWRVGEDERLMEVMKEMREKEERIQVLQAKLASMEHQELKRDREMDILRQSLRIMSHRKKATNMARGRSKNLEPYEQFNNM